MREVRVSANTDGRPLQELSNDINAAAAKLRMPPGYDVVAGGDTEELEIMFRNMFQALMLAVIFIYLILASQFGSFTHPLAIMLSLPLSLVGVAVMLYFTHDTLNIMSMIGLIMLMGLVTKNAILLVDFTNQARREGMPRHQALLQAGTTRLRPIVMTTLAMIFGMLPLAFAIGAGAEMRAPMARAVIGGLITSTLLSLLVVPVVYTFLDDFRPSMLWGWTKWFRRAPALGSAQPVRLKPDSDRLTPARSVAFRRTVGRVILWLRYEICRSHRSRASLLSRLPHPPSFSRARSSVRSSGRTAFRSAAPKSRFSISSATP